MYWGTCKAGPNSETQRCSLEKAVNCYLWSTAKREHLNLYHSFVETVQSTPPTYTRRKLSTNAPAVTATPRITMGASSFFGGTPEQLFIVFA